MISCLLSNAFMKLFGNNESMRLLSRLQLHLVNDAFVIRGRTEVGGAESRHSNRRCDAAKKKIGEREKVNKRQSVADEAARRKTSDDEGESEAQRKNNGGPRKNR